jgi:hypothetical protein
MLPFSEEGCDKGKGMGGRFATHHHRSQQGNSGDEADEEDEGGDDEEEMGSRKHKKQIQALRVVFILALYNKY